MELEKYLTTATLDDLLAKLLERPEMYAEPPAKLAAYLGVPLKVAAALQVDNDFFQQFTQALTRRTINPLRMVRAMDALLREAEEGRGRMTDRVAALRFLAQQTDTLRPTVARQETEQTFRVVLTYGPADVQSRRSLAAPSSYAALSDVALDVEATPAAADDAGGGGAAAVAGARAGAAPVEEVLPKEEA